MRNGCHSRPRERSKRVVLVLDSVASFIPPTKKCDANLVIFDIFIEGKLT